MNRFCFALLIISALCLGWIQDAFAEGVNCLEPVKVAQGKLEGFEDGGSETCAYLGIPFAAPPVGDLRWKAPQPPDRWNGIRQAKEFGPWCMQKEGLDTMSAKHDMSEDCLYLNVWRPKKEGRLPVMVWIHGGGYMSGSGSLDMYRGDHLAGEGEVVVVTINYRLNVFGFLAHNRLADEDPNGSTGNYGSLDQVAALKWVKRNIAAFGGDPENVTIFGESAGGWSVCTMVATPLSAGLFQRAIIESGGCQESMSVEDGHQFAVELAEKVGCAPDDLQCLRNQSPEKLIKAGWVNMMSDNRAYINHIDGRLLKKSPLEMIRAGEHNKVPMIVGSNRDEARPLATLNPKYDCMTKRKYKRVIKREYPEDYEQILKLYPPEKFPKPIDALDEVITDKILGCSGYLAADALARQPEPVYYYRFDYDDVRFKKWVGAFHGLEIAFVFEAFDRLPIGLAFKKKHYEAANVLSDKIMAYWVAFARTGDPNHAEGVTAGLPEWPAFEPEGSRKRIVFDHNITLMTEPAIRDDQCGFWELRPRW